MAHYAKFFYTLFIIFISYFLVLVSYYAILSLASFAHSRKRTLESKEEDYRLLLKSRFTMPVSIIVPAHNEEIWIGDCLKALLNLNYPKFEIIVVNDNSTDKTMDILNAILHLRPLNKTYIPQPKSGTIQAVAVSEKYPHVTVVTKTGLKKAGTVNAGLSFARYDYVCAIDADTILEPDALMKVMMHIELDPDRIVGAGSYFGLVNGFKIKDGKVLEHSFSYNPILAYQNLEYLRSFIGNRLSWSVLNAVPIVSGGFGIWRRDVIAEAGGYDPDFTCEDIEFTFRVHDYIVKNKKDYRVISLPYSAAWTEGPSTIGALISQRERWQRVTNETIWRYKYMLFNPRYKWFAFLTFPYFVVYEVLGVFFEITSVGAVLWASVLGILDLNTFFAYLGLMALSQTLISLFVLLAFLRDQTLFRIRYSLYLALLSFCEFLFYRWILSIAKLIGTIRYLFGVKTFGQYQRSRI